MTCRIGFRSVVLAAAAAIAAACSSPAAVTDAGAPDGIAPPAAPAPPGAPSAPSLAPCRAGWQATVGAEGSVECEPWPAPAPACGPDEALFAGTIACSLLGDPCPAAEWSTDLPALGVVYVRAGAPVGGTGTRGSPFGTIADALGAAPAGTIVALSRGSFDEPVRLPAGVTLRGACVAGTLVTSSAASDTAGVVTVEGANAAVENLTLGGARPGVWIQTGSVRLDDVLIDGASLAGLAAFDGATATGRRLVVRNTRGSAFDGFAGRGMNLEAAAVVDLEQVVVEANREDGVFATDPGTTVRLRDAVLRATLLVGGFGDGAAIADGATLDAAGLVVENNEGLGLFAIGVGARMLLSDGVVRSQGDGGIQLGTGAAGTFARVRLQDNASTGLLVNGAETAVTVEHAIVRRSGQRAISVQNGATATVRSVLFSQNQATAVLVSGPPAHLVLEDAVIRDHPSNGLMLQNGGAAELSRVVIERSQGWGVTVRDSGTTARLLDVAIRDTASRSDGMFGRGIEVRVQAHIEATRVLVERGREIGVFVEGTGTSAILSDLTVRDTEATLLDGERGRGLEVEAGGDVSVERALVANNRDVGIMAGGAGTRLTLLDVTVQDTRGTASQGFPGDGLLVNGGAQATLGRGLFQRNREVSIAVFEPASSLVATDVVVEDTLPRDCATTSCVGFGAGIGIGAYLDGHLDLRRFRVSRSTLCGVQVGGPDATRQGGTIDLHEGEISSNPIGANVQSPLYDLVRLSDNVAFRDNLQNLDLQTLPSPETVVPSF